MLAAATRGNCVNQWKRIVSSANGKKLTGLVNSNEKSRILNLELQY